MNYVPTFNWFGSSLTPSSSLLSSTSWQVVSLSQSSCMAGRASWREKGGKGGAAGEKPNHTTTRQPGPTKSINHSILTRFSYWCLSNHPLPSPPPGQYPVANTPSNWFFFSPRTNPFEVDPEWVHANIWAQRQPSGRNDFTWDVGSVTCKYYHYCRIRTQKTPRQK